MKKIISISVFLIILFVLPLAGSFSLLISWPIIVVAFFCTLLLATQPVMCTKESAENSATDKGTMWLILLVSAGGQITSVLEWAYIQHAPQMISLYSFVGLLLMTFGITFRVWAISTLKKAFSATVQIKVDQKLITSGPYQWFRHPSYTGAYLLMIGDALLLHSLMGLLIFTVGMLWVYSRRITTEEQTLEKAFGKDYAKMKSSTWKMLPGW